MRQAGDDVPCGHQHSWSTVAALQTMICGERVAEVSHDRIVVIAFDGLNFGTVATDRLDYAGPCRHVVDHDRTSPAYTFFTSE